MRQGTAVKTKYIQYAVADQTQVSLYSHKCVPKYMKSRKQSEAGRRYVSYVTKREGDKGGKEGMRERGIRGR